MKIICKYPINRLKFDTFETYEGFKPLHVGIDHNNEMCVWLQVDTTNKPIVAEAKVVATGEAIDFYAEGTADEINENRLPRIKPFQFVGTVIRNNGLVWHIYLR